LTVVVASGNAGPGQVSSPGWDPYVLTTGAVDNRFSTDPNQSSVAVFSGSKSFNGFAKPDVLAPGVSVVSLRAPGSAIDKLFPSARVENAYFVGSGTSMATAVMSGVAAVIVQHHPNAAPDDVKGAVISTARQVKGSTIAAGEVDLANAVAAPANPKWNQHYGTIVGGLTLPWEQKTWSSTRWSSTRWSAQEWSGTKWSAADWQQLWTTGDLVQNVLGVVTGLLGSILHVHLTLALSSLAWDGSRWSGSRWSGSRWSGSRWSGDGWGAT
jgi:serine protease AprX